jgi:hypothetical protein
MNEIMKKIKRYFQATLLSLMTMFTFAAATPLADTAGAACQQRILTFPVWYNGLDMNQDDCTVKNFKLNDFWVIVLNGIEILLQAVAYVSVGFIVWGGFKYIKSQGDPGKISEAKMAIINAIIGLVIALGSVAIVAFIQGGITQP